MGSSRRVHRVSWRQLEMLWEFVYANRDVASGNNRSIRAKEFAKRKWTEIANMLNSVGDGTHKSWVGWNKYWVDYKAKLKHKVAALRAAKSSDGGPSTAKPLTEVEQKFLCILGDKFGHNTPVLKVETCIPPPDTPATETPMQEEPMSESPMPPIPENHSQNEMLADPPTLEDHVNPGPFPRSTSSARRLLRRRRKPQDPVVAALDKIANVMQQMVEDNRTFHSSVVRIKTERLEEPSSPPQEASSWHVPVAEEIRIVPDIQVIIKGEPRDSDEDEPAFEDSVSDDMVVSEPTTSKEELNTMICKSHRRARGVRDIKRYINRRNDDILISLVERYEELYNLKHRHYHNQVRRDSIWDEIGEVMNENELYQKGSSGGYVCQICRKSFANRGNVQRHLLLHTRKTFKCDQCNGEFLNKMRLDRHIFNRHTQPNERAFECTDCFKKFKSSSNLMQHKRTHLPEKPFKCSTCFKTFSFKTNLNKHQGKSRCKQPSEKPLICHFCQKVFNKEYLLKSHLRKHDNDRPFACDLCSMHFKHKSTLIRHMQLHNGVRPYACPVCKKTFTSSGLLKPHMRVHTGEKPYTCHICDKKFAHKQNMQRHVLGHDKIKHTVCDICHKQFPRESRLKYHMRTHVNEKHFLCHVCPKRFSHKQNVLRHYTRKHPGQTYNCSDTDASVALRVWDSIKSKYYDDQAEEILG